MAVTGVNPVSNTNTNTTSNATDKSNATVNYNNFLQLLIAQMKNQDPTDPMDASQQVAQLATFSQVEQSVKMNTNLESLLKSQNISQATSFIGKTLTSSDGNTSGVVASIKITNTGLVATTTTGKEITIGSGIVVKN